MTESPPMTRYAGIYTIATNRLVRGTPRITEAAARLAHYLARRSARRDHRTPGAVLSTQIGEPARVNGIALFGQDRIAVKVEIETSDGTT